MLVWSEYLYNKIGSVCKTGGVRDLCFSEIATILAVTQSMYQLDAPIPLLFI
jgi:hypothetical protein